MYVFIDTMEMKQWVFFGTVGELFVILYEREVWINFEDIHSQEDITDYLMVSLTIQGEGAEQMPVQYLSCLRRFSYYWVEKSQIKKD
jgi:hypothetical protein